MNENSQISSRELKVGLGVISILVIALGTVVAKRFLIVSPERPTERQVASATTAQESAEPTPTEVLRPRVLPVQSRTAGTGLLPPLPAPTPNARLASSPRSLIQAGSTAAAQLPIPMRTIDPPASGTPAKPPHLPDGGVPLRIRDAPIADWSPPASATAAIPPRPLPLENVDRPLPLAPRSRPGPRTLTSQTADLPTADSLPAPTWTAQTPAPTTAATAAPASETPPVDHRDPEVDTAPRHAANDSPASLTATTARQARPISNDRRRPSTTQSASTGDSTQIATQNSSERRTYLIEEGDTLWDIAFYELGDAELWTELYRLNAEKLGPDPTDLKPGTWIELPVGMTNE